MAFPITIEITIMVNSEEQAAAIMEASVNGLAETAIKDRVLYGGLNFREPVVKQVAEPVVADNVKDVKTVKAEEEQIELNKIDTGTPTIKVVTPVKTKERPRSIIGRGRLGRN